MERRSVSHSAPYGHACMSCFKAKCRCIPRTDGDGCERCLRLGRQCIPSNSIRRRAVEQKQAPRAQAGAVIDGLASRFRSQSGGASEPAGGHAARVGPAQGLGPVPGLDGAMDPFFAVPNHVPDFRLPEPSGSSPAACLDTFRSYMLPHLPLFNLPAHMTAQQLHFRRPFLFRAITCVASPTSRERHTRSSELKRVLHDLIFLRGPEHGAGARSDNAGKTVDLLLGILVYVAWGLDHRLVGRLLMLAASLVGELCSEGPPPPDAYALGLLIPETNGRASIGYDHESAFAEDELEWQRAILACFLLSCSASTYLGQVDAMRWTPHMDRALAAMSATRLQSDHVLALQVRVQLLTEQAFQIRYQSYESDHAAAESLLERLEVLRSVIQQHQVGSLHAHLHYAELAIHEALRAGASIVATTLAPNPTPPSGSTWRFPGGRTEMSAGTGASSNRHSPTASAPDDNDHIHRSTPSARLSPIPWPSLSAVHSCTAALLALPSPLFRGIALPQWAQLSRCLVTLRSLHISNPAATAPHEGFPDLPGILGALEERLEGLAREAGETPTVGSRVTDQGMAVTGSGTFGGLACAFRGLRERVVLEFREGVLRPGGVGGHDKDGNAGVAGLGPEGEEVAAFAPQKGYFPDQRFWMEQAWTGEDSCSVPQ
ncbi:hypothetical protein VTH06DRAFT_8682 [Thermothelomyces fergusii]